MRPLSGERLKIRRKAAKFTQYELALLCRCSQAAISGLETGNMEQCSEDLARQICKWLDRDLEELFVESPTSRTHRVTNALGSSHQKDEGHEQQLDAVRVPGPGRTNPRGKRRSPVRC
ncbi:helix-turn-helix transcriptional regulator [Kocuria rhizophila]|uniref:helix-turn-helix transcriptional regulator n=1 Tax=Kocuria rhizophila TaxID=72000 RepID=UPI003D6EB4DB